MKKCASGRDIYANVCSVEYKRPLQLLFSTRAGPAEDDPPLYKSGSKPVQAVCKGAWSS